MTTNNAPATTGNNVPAVSPVDRLKSILSVKSVEDQFKNCMADSAPLFIASLIDLYGSDSYMQKCEPKAVVMEALKAAVLRLPIAKSLGFAYIVPFNDNKVGKVIPTFIIGYKGLIQLAMRTGAYKHLNADVVYEGELKDADRLTGGIDLTGTKKSDKVVGYFAHLETVNGFRKTVYMAAEDMATYAKRYSKSYNKASSTWQTQTDAMGIKTMLRRLLGKYGVMSIEFANSMAYDDDEISDDSRFSSAAGINANTGEIIDIDPVDIPPAGDMGGKQEQCGPGF